MACLLWIIGLYRINPQAVDLWVDVGMSVNNPISDVQVIVNSKLKYSDHVDNSGMQW